METAGAADPGAVQDPAGVEPWRRVAAVAGLMGNWELDFVQGTTQVAAATTPSGGTATWFRVDGR